MIHYFIWCICYIDYSKRRAPHLANKLNLSRVKAYISGVYGTPDSQVVHQASRALELA